ncbi:MAG: class glutamine amidotransferase [Solirubrobacterales bacterium]|nr:class glutamine amidotransferase [Solirubrobacterales bacterium]
MCRLFGMSGGARRVRATFWLLEAPDSLARQSRREPDGTGLGFFAADGTPEVRREPVAAYRDAAFAAAAQEVCSRTFVAHVRYASTGAVSMANTHPFEQRGRLFAHNGVIGDVGRLERELGDYRALVHGETDSERFFALITREIDGVGGDVGTGIARAARRLAAGWPVYSLNLVLVTATELWALRYPDRHELFVLERERGGPHGDRHLEQASAAGSVRVRSGDLAAAPVVVVASEPMDDNPEWRPLAPGELLHVGADLAVTSITAVPQPPEHPLELADLHPRAAASQAPSRTRPSR